MATFGRIIGRTTKASVGLAALFVLMAAKSDGCFGEDPGGDPEPPPPPVEECPPGHHLELICDDDHDCDEGDDDDPPMPGEVEPATYGGDELPPWIDDDGGPGECEEICVPDEVCPEGTYEELICEGSPEPPPPWEGPCLDPQGCEYPEPEWDDEPVWDDEGWEECHSICVPLEECGPGFVEEWICEEPVNYGMGPCLDPQGCVEPPPEPECFPICIPDDELCPPGLEPQMVCDDDGCWEDCVGYPPGDEPVEPPMPGPEPGQEPGQELPR